MKNTITQNYSFQNHIVYVQSYSFLQYRMANSIPQKRFFTSNSKFRKISKYISNNISVILEDEKRVSTYFKNNFPKSFKYLPVVKLITGFFMVIIVKLDYETYLTVVSATVENESVTFYSKYIFGFYFGIILYEFVLSIYVTLKTK